MTAIGIPARPAGEWDAPAAQVAAEFTALKAKALRDGLLDEQRHQYLDLDPDSVYRLPGCTCVTCPPKNQTGGQS